MAIANAVRRGPFIVVYNERGMRLTMIAVAMQAGDGLTGYTSSAVSVKRGAVMITYDEKGRQLSMTPAG